MGSRLLKDKVLRHLSASKLSWAHIVEKVSLETGAGQLFVEKALREMIEEGEVVRCNDSNTPTYQAPGNQEGKYSNYNVKRFDQWPKRGGPYDYKPDKEPLTPKKGA